MKTVLLLFVLVVCAWQNATAQEIRLDSLWAKQGGVFAMSFSPDSKTLAIGEDGDEGQIRIFEAQTGREIDSIPHSFYVDLAFTPDGKKLLAIDQTGIKLFNGTTYKYERTISYDQGGLIAFSPDESKLALAGDSWIAIVDIQKGEVLAKLTRPDSYVPDPKHPTTTNPYWNGKVSFSADGKYIIGKYENSLVRWDWQNTPTKPEILIGSFGNRAIIGFSPDKKYLVQQSNYLWDLQQGKQIAVEGVEASYTENGDVADFSFDTKNLICTRNEQTRNDRLTIVDIPLKKLIYTSNYSANSLSLSPDKQMLAFHGTGNYTRLYRLHWNPNSSVSEQEVFSRISVSPLPGQETIRIEIQTPTPYLNCHISVVSLTGSTIGEIYQGNVSIGKQSFTFPTTGLSSGQYSVVMSYSGKTTSVPFIITK